MSITLAAQLEEVSVIDAQGGVQLDDVSFPVLPGEALAVCGPTGGGKTTLLRLLAALVHPTRGRVRIATLDPTTLDYEGLRALRLRVGIAFETGGFWGTRSVYENIALPMLYHHPDRSDVELKVRDLADEVGLPDDLGRPGAALSSAERKRAMVARALLFEPALLLVDEPQHGHLPREARRLSDAIEARRKHRGMTVVYADHDGKLAPFVCERRLFLEGGRIVERLSRIISRHDREDFNIGLPRDSLLGDAPESAS